MYTTKKQLYFCLAILSAISFFWLISNLFYADIWKGIFQETNPDSLLFTRHLEQSLLKGETITTDNYAAFPYEVKTGFAPFYMSFIVSLVNIVFAVFPNLSIDPIYVAGTLPILFTWITITLLIFSIYKLSNNRILTLFCAFFMLPGYSAGIVNGFLNLDYDYLITFYIWCWLINAAFFMKTSKHIYVYLGAIVTALFISTWTGTPFFYFFAVMYALVAWLKDYKNNSSYISYTYLTMLIGGIVALLFVPRNEDTIRYFLEGNVGRYSYIQGLLIVIGAIFVLMLDFIAKKIWLEALRNINSSNIKAIGIGLFILFAIIVLVFFREPLLQATGILFKTDPVHLTIVELTKGFAFDDFFGSAIRDSITRFGILFFLIPTCLFMPFSKELRLIKNWLLIFMFLAVFYQIRYMRWVSCGYGLLMGFVCYYLWNSFKNSISDKRFLLQKVSLAIFPILLISSILNYSVISSCSKLSIEQIELLTWIKEYTPLTSGYSDNNRPEYGILSYWDQGNKISYYSKRPVAVSNSLWGYQTMAQVFASENESEAYKICNDKKLKYIVIEPSREISNNILNYWAVLKNMPETAEYKLYYGEVPTKESFDYFYFWLANNLALTPLGEFGTSNHFRVVFANKNEPNLISRYLIFERVKGAVFELSDLRPHSKVSISLELKLDKLQFIYKVNKTSDENGHCSFVLPYSNDYDNGNITTDPFYKVSIEQGEEKELAKLVVDENSVINGTTVNSEAIQKIKKY